jgi:myo-inositol-hexaphosphate 3-phosphohydrolase
LTGLGVRIKDVALDVGVFHKSQRLIFAIDRQKDAVGLDLNTLSTIKDILTGQIDNINIQFGFKLGITAIELIYCSLFAMKSQLIIIGQVGKSFVNSFLQSLVRSGQGDEQRWHRAACVN